MEIIRIRGARTHNLKNINLDLPRHQLVVITGLSGSGKSSIAFDTLYAEGQRRYVESLSAYARQFLQLMEKPAVDAIEGLSPAIAIEQKATSHHPRSTVGTVTEIHDYLRLLYARVGTPYCPTHHRPLTALSVSQMVDAVLALPPETKLMILAPTIESRKGQHIEFFETMQAQGFIRFRVYSYSGGKNNKANKPRIVEIGDLPALNKQHKHTIAVVVDRLKVRTDIKQRVAESFETALRLADGRAIALEMESGREHLFSAKFACPMCSYALQELEPRLFSFNSPMGACPTCGGLGQIASAFTFASASASTASAAAASAKSVHLFTNRFGIYGIDTTANQRYQRCPACEGTRLRAEARYVKIGEDNKAYAIDQMSRWPLRDVLDYFLTLSLTGAKREIADRIVKEITARLTFLNEVGLDYLSLDRSADTLSGGEAQRIRLASQIGSGLTGVMYVLDEPSIGLHQRDNDRLIKTLTHLRDLGNSVIVVEHDEALIRAADHVVDMGPGAGERGGQVVSQGTPQQIIADPHSLTGQYLAAQRCIELPTVRKKSDGRLLRIVNATGNNLKHITLTLPVGLLTCVTGVSGSGKSTLINDTLYWAVANHLHGASAQPQPPQHAPFDAIEGLDYFDKIINVDQSPIGRTPRSNPATYTGVLTPIRELFAGVPEAKQRGYRPGRFSFNVKGGRCEACEGGGMLKVEMHFLPDIYVQCDVCNGKRYNRETLEIRYKGKTINEVLELTVEQAYEYFRAVPAIAYKLKTLLDVGLGYIRLGQSATTLSGGEAQRVKLSLELSKRQTGRTLYILDEPTTGLHFQDVSLLLDVIYQLREAGNTIVVIEHHLDVIKTADWVIDLGPEGGARGGQIIAEGTPEAIAASAISLTGKYLKPFLTQRE